MMKFARILIWGSFGDFCVCIQTQSNLVIIINIIIIINEAWGLIIFGPFLIKSSREVWRLNVFAPFLLIIILPLLLAVNLSDQILRD